MATIQTFTYFDSTNLANFKLWAQAISNAFSTFGWARSADTGQVTWASVTLPGVGSSVYEIWNMQDAVQATNPVYLKVEYGQGSSGGNPLLALTVGNGSNGAGTLTNAGTRVLLANTNGSLGGTTYECDLSGSTNRMQFTMWRPVTSACFFSIERSHDANGNDTAGYVTYLAAGPQLGLTCVQQTITPAASGGPLFTENLGLTVQTQNTTATFNNSVAVAPFWPFVGKLDNPLMGALCLKKGDFSDGAQFSASMYTVTHNFLVTKSVQGSWGNQTTNSIAMRWE